MIKKLLLITLFILCNNFACSASQPQDALDHFDKAIDNIKINPIVKNPIVTDNEIIIRNSTNPFKKLEAKFYYNNTRLALLFTSAILSIISARSLLQKNSNRGKFLFASSILSFICNDQLAYIISKNEGKVSLALLAIAYFHKVISKHILTTEIYNFIYNKKG